ncbi:GDT1-like protein 1, chloroplastic [Tanacetum coccineum]
MYHNKVMYPTGLAQLATKGNIGEVSLEMSQAFLLIFFSELGDKTFFIAALLAARNSAAVVFTGTFGALGIMTVISVVLGRTFHYVDEILPFRRFGDTDPPIDDIAAALLLVYFGVSTLLDASSGNGLKAEEQEAEIAVSEVLGNGAGILAAASTIISTFLLVFVVNGIFLHNCSLHSCDPTLLFLLSSFLLQHLHLFE